MMRLQRITSTAMILVLLPGIASAQKVLEEVVVTAQKRAESLQDVPVAVSAFQGDALENYGVTDTKALQISTPSLVFNNRGPVAQPFIRGIGTTLSLLGLEPSVATYVDDQYFPRPIGNIVELPDVERIEVLKGPQGTLYGRNATGGAIRIVTKDPSAEFESKLKFSAGNFGYGGLSGYVAGGLTDSLFANFSILIKQRDGFGENLVPGVDDLDDLDVQSYRTKLVWDVSETVSAKLAIDYTERNDTAGSETIDISSSRSVYNNLPGSLGGSIAAGLGAPTGRSQDAIFSNVDAENEFEMFNTNLRIDVDLASMTFSSITTYQDSSNKTNSADFDTSPLILSEVSDDEDNEALSQEFQLVSDGSGALRWVAGLYYFESDGTYRLAFDGQQFPPIGTVLVSPTSVLDTTAYAVFGQATYDLSDSFSLTLGGRYSWEEKEVASTSGTIPVGSAQAKQDWNEFTPKATLEYATDNGIFYLTYAAGFKSGGFAYPFVGGVTDAPVQPETLDMFELGAKLDLLGSTLRLNAALYNYDYEDLQVNRNAGIRPGVGLVIPVENAGGAEVTGLEVDLTWLATDNLTLTGGFNAMSTEYTDYPNATPNVYNNSVLPGPVVFAVPYNANGDDLIRAPDLAAYLSAEYVFNVGNGATLPVNLTYSYKSEFDFDLIPGDSTNRIEENRHDAYSLLNARIAYRPASERWSLAVWGNNLADEEYFDEVVSFATAVRATVGAPRTYGVDFNLYFD